MAFSNDCVCEIAKRLFSQGRVFCSEADFQHSLAMVIEKVLDEKHVNADVRLEFPYGDDHLDIVVFVKDRIVPIELKYKTIDVGEISNQLGVFRLKNQNAQDAGRYLFLKDLERLEGIRKDMGAVFKCGYAVFLTNDHLYTEQSRGQVCININLVDSIIHGTKSLNSDAHWVIDNPLYGNGVVIASDYVVKWTPIKLQGIDFWCLVLEVKQEGQK